MKKLPITFVILFNLYFMLNFRAISQTSGFDLKAGFSVPEMFHFGSAYHFSNNQRIEIKLGSNFVPEDIYNTATLIYGWHLGKTSAKGERKPWSLNPSYTLSFVNNSQVEGYSSFINLYFSRDIFLTKRWFIQPELGWAIPAFNNTFIKDDMYEGYNLPFIIKFGFNVGYKL
jgi:hypothetical protein